MDFRRLPLKRFCQSGTSEYCGFFQDGGSPALPGEDKTGILITNENNKESYPMKENVQKVLDLIRPALQADGGDVELVDITDDGVVSVKLTGACGSCPMSTMTLKMGIERTLRDKVPEVKEVVQV
jgi:Fe-S cluster biogenesis protein NfuA